MRKATALSKSLRRVKRRARLKRTTPWALGRESGNQRLEVGRNPDHSSATPSPTTLEGSRNLSADSQSSRRMDASAAYRLLSSLHIFHLANTHTNLHILDPLKIVKNFLRSRYRFGCLIIFLGGRRGGGGRGGGKSEFSKINLRQFFS